MPAFTKTRKPGCLAGLLSGYLPIVDTCLLRIGVVAGPSEPCPTTDDPEWFRTDPSRLSSFGRSPHPFFARLRFVNHKGTKLNITLSVVGSTVMRHCISSRHVI